MISLKTTLLINGVSSAATGVLLAVFSSPIATLFGVQPTSPFVSVGLFLIGFATFVLVTALKKPLNPRAVSLIIALDVLWVLASAVAVLVLASTISLLGTVAIVAVAVWVVVMAYLQQKGLKAIA